MCPGTTTRQLQEPALVISAASKFQRIRLTTSGDLKISFNHSKDGLNDSSP